MGALAVGLLATVDPFEQLKKGTDTSIRNTTSEIYNSAIRYYSVKNTFPWTADVTGVSLADPSFTNSPSGYLQMIITAGELKPEFIQLAGGGLNSIYITSTANAGVRQNVATCFLPQSKSFANDTNSKYASNGVITAGCAGTQAGGATCYWCIK